VWWNYIAFYALLGGIIGAGRCCDSGLIDWLPLKEPQVVRVANWHARLNIIALLIYASSFYLRTTSGARLVSGSHAIPIALSVLGVILISISGYLRGEMVYSNMA
jgi:uncharacterized membrane protein